MTRTTRTTRTRRSELSLWQCCWCGHGGMTVHNTPQCVSCFHHARCQTCHTEGSTLGGKPPRLTDFEFLPDPMPDDDWQCNTSGPTLSIPQSMDASTPARQIKSGLDGQSQYSPSLELEGRTEQVLLMQNLSLNELPALGASPKSSVDTRHSEVNTQMMKAAESHGHAADVHRDDDSQSSPGVSTSDSELSEPRQGNGYEREFNVKCDTILQILRTPLDELFEQWFQGMRDHNGGERASSPARARQKATDDGKRQESKRKRADHSDEQDTDTNPDRPGVAGKKRRKTMPLDTQLACPYFKKDPRHHRACCGIGGQNISRVKQHLKRNHTIPPYCPVCFLEFAGEQFRDEHIRARSCGPLENRQAPQGITLDQRHWLSRRGPPNLSDWQHWYRIFEYLFPGHPLPRSAYNDMTFSEEFLDFRDFISEPSGLDMLLSRVRENPSWTAEHEALFGPDIGHGLGQLYWMWAAARQGDSGRAIAVENPIQDSQAAPSPVRSEEVRQSDSQTEDGSGTYENSSNLSASMPRDGEQAASQNALSSPLAEQEQVDHPEVERGAAAINASGEGEKQRPDNDKTLGESGEPSIIGLDQIRHDQPQASLTSLDYLDNEFYDLLGDDTQGVSPSGDFEIIYPAAGFDESGIWSIPSTFGVDDALYLLEELQVPDEDNADQGEAGFWIT